MTGMSISWQPMRSISSRTICTAFWCTRQPAGSHDHSPAPTCRARPARTSSLCDRASASPGACFSVGRTSWDCRRSISGRTRYLREAARTKFALEGSTKSILGTCAGATPPGLPCQAVTEDLASRPKELMSSPVRPAAVALAALALAYAFPAAAHASPTQLSIMQDDDELVYRDDATRDRALQRMKALGVDA